MAAFCPCGCERKLSLAELHMGEEPKEDLDLEPKEDVEAFIEEGREIGDNLIAVIHGEVPADAFERGSTDHWLKAARAMELNTMTNLAAGSQTA